MKLTIERTDKEVRIASGTGNVVARVWRGMLDGKPSDVYVVGIGIHGPDAEAYDRALEEPATPFVPICSGCEFAVAHEHPPAKAVRH